MSVLREPTLEELIAGLRIRHHGCFCYLQPLIHYLSDLYHNAWLQKECKDLAVHYLLLINEGVLPFVDCKLPTNGAEDWSMFDWPQVQRFCRDRRNAAIVRLLSGRVGSFFAGHLPTLCKYGDWDDCLRQAELYHRLYDALIYERRSKAFLFLCCLRAYHSRLYGVRDMRRVLWALITDCSSDNGLAELPALADLFKKNE